MYRGIVRCDMAGNIPDKAVDAFKDFLEAFSNGELYIYDNGQNEVTVNKQDLEDTYKEFCAKSRENNEDEDFDKVKKKLIEEDKENKSKIIKIINIAIWLWALPIGKKPKWIEKSNLKDDLSKIQGVAGGGQGYLQQKTNGIRFILYLLWQLRSKLDAGSSGDDLGVKLKDIILDLALAPDSDKYKYGVNNEYSAPLGVRNLLLHLCAHEKYPPIASTENKKDIVKAFWECLEGQNRPGSEQIALQNLDTTLINIKKILIGDSGTSFKEFYEDTIRPFWDTPEQSINVDKDGNLPLDVLLKFKKAIVLYGPPGTSKTFTARKLAKKIISIDFAEKYKGQGDKYSDFFKNARTIFGEKEEIPIGHADPSQNEIKPHIHRLQLHPNYTYDDFIAGKTITKENGKTEIKTQNGYLLKLIDDISKDESAYKDLPHIVILDEINRVDISRVFGELFTAMEPGYRKEGVDLPLTDNGGTPLKLKVPENLYFIGTMNLIDFSLEQVDFALRRRFAWVERNYNEAKLKKILGDKINDNKIEDIDEETVSNYIKKCSALNNDKISKQQNLGPAYQIGHTFFAEVIDIYKELRGNKQDNDKKIWNSSVEFLWNISIKPMIEAYCGTMDSEAQENFIEICKNEFCPKS